MEVCIKNNIRWNSHRSGWGYVMDLLKPFHSDSAGLILDGFIDASFGFMATDFQDREIIPYMTKWVGFWHHPVNISPWVKKDNIAPEAIICKTNFQKSLPYCLGIFTFSKHLSSYLEERLDVPVNRLYHPTVFPEKTFDFDKFIEGKKIIQVGSWMRKLTSFYLFRAEGYEKYHLLGKTALEYLKDEMRYYGNKKFYVEDVNFIGYVNNDIYDDFLCESLVFADVYDSSVNNSIIECIVRNTPIVINKIPPVVEYLGESYPLFFQKIDEIPKIINDIGLIYEAHQYLKELPDKRKLKGDYFIDTLVNSEIMKRM